MALEIGINAPEIDSYINGNSPIKLSDFRGKWVVLYFYPKDNTSGCTKEACSFNENLMDFSKIDAEILGVSPDSVKSHDNFVNKYSLNFKLIADPDKKICDDFKVLGEKSMYGKKYIGVIRSTYIIDPIGVIRHVFSNVKVDGHTEAVLEKIKELKGN